MNAKELINELHLETLKNFSEKSGKSFDFVKKLHDETEKELKKDIDPKTESSKFYGTLTKILKLKLKLD